MATYHSPFGRGYRPRFPKGKARQRPNPSKIRRIATGFDTSGRPKAHRHHFEHPVFVEAQLHSIKAPAHHVAGVTHRIAGATRSTGRR